VLPVLLQSVLSPNLPLVQLVLKVCFQTRLRQSYLVLVLVNQTYWVR
jgi:hypothetical protein